MDIDEFALSHEISAAAAKLNKLILDAHGNGYMTRIEVVETVDRQEVGKEVSLVKSEYIRPHVFRVVL